jgi:hypothetical protein
LWSGLPPIKVQDKTFEEFAQSFAQSARVNGIPKPEPVAYIDVETRKLEWATPIKWETPTVVKMDKVPLYTTPPKKEWVGLTDKEIEQAAQGGDTNFWDFCRIIGAKLKEKNGG